MSDHSTILNNGRLLAYAHSPCTNKSLDNCSKLLRSPHERPTGVLFCGGFKSNMQGQKALAFNHHCQSRDIPFTRFDYNGHGDSEGEFIEGDIGSWLDDALCILDNICTTTADKVVVIGSSMGAWIATLLAQQRNEKVAGLLTLAAAPDFTERLLRPALSDDQRRCLDRGETIKLPSDYDDGSPYPISSHLIEQSQHQCVLNSDIDIKAPVRLLHGTGDKDVPYSLSIELMNAIQSTDVQLTLIKDADHRLSSPDNLRTTISTLDALLDRIET